MNERIKELAEQSGAKVSTIGGIFVNKTNMDIEKFAELIVQECADFVDRSISDGGIDGRELKEHFGVEECSN